MKLNKLTKFLIIFGYTSIMFLLVFLLFGPKKTSLYDSYKTTPYDDHIGVMVKVTENRQSKYETYNKNNEDDKKNKLGSHEKSVFDIDVVLIKLRVESLYDVSTNVAVKTANNSYLYQNNVRYGDFSKGTFVNLSGDFNKMTSKEFVNVSDGQSKLIDETPKEVFIQISYKYLDTGSNSKKEKVLQYKFETLELGKKEIKKYNERTSFVSEETDPTKLDDIQNNLYIEPKNDVVALQIGKKLATLETTLDTIQKDSFKINLDVVNSNLNNYKTNLELSDNNKRIELPTLNNVNPEISEIKMAIFGKIESLDKKFSNFVTMYSLYGFCSSVSNRLVSSNEDHKNVSTNNNTHLVSFDIDSSLNLSEIYVTINCSLFHSTEKDVQSKYKVDVNNLVSIDDVYKQTKATLA